MTNKKFFGKIIEMDLETFIKYINAEYDPSDKIIVTDLSFDEKLDTVEELIIYLGKLDKDTYIQLSESMEDGKVVRKFPWGYIIPNKNTNDTIKESICWRLNHMKKRYNHLERQNHMDNQKDDPEWTSGLFCMKDEIKFLEELSALM